MAPGTSAAELTCCLYLHSETQEKEEVLLPAAQWLLFWVPKRRTFAYVSWIISLDFHGAFIFIFLVPQVSQLYAKF